MPTREEMIAYLKNEGSSKEPSREEMIAALKGSPTANENDVIEEVMHPDISFGERAIAKNFANSPEKMAAYIKQEHPQMEVKQDMDGNVIARNPGEKSWKKLDPQSSWEEKKNDIPGMLKELGMDIADVGYDTLSSIGTGVATAAGGLMGNLPGAAATGALASGAAETGRQALGQGFGIPQEFSGSDIATQTGIGAVSPLLFGTGKVGLEGAKKAAQSGLFGRMIPKVGELLTGIDSGVLKNLPKNLDTIKKMANMGDAGSNLEKLAETVKSKINTSLRTEAQAISSAIKQADVPVDLGEFKNYYKGQIADLEKQYAQLPTGEMKTRLEEVISQINKMTRSPDLPAVPKIEGSAGIMNFVPAKSAVPAQAGKELPTLMEPEAAWELQKMLGELADYSKLPKVGLQGIKENASQSGKDIQRFANEGYKLIEKELERVTDTVGVGLKNRYANLKRLQRSISPMFKDADSTYRNLISLDKPSKAIKLEQIMATDKYMGTNIMDAANLMKTYNTFGSQYIPENVQTSVKKKGGASVLGAVLGWAYGGFPGSVAGGLAGQAAASPLAVRGYVRGGQALRWPGMAAQKLTKNIVPVEQNLLRYGLDRSGAVPAAYNQGASWLGIGE